MICKWPKSQPCLTTSYHLLSHTRVKIIHFYQTIANRPLLALGLGVPLSEAKEGGEAPLVLVLIS